MEENHDKNSKKEQELHFNEFMDKINASSSKCNVQKNKSEFNSSNVTPNYLTQLLKDQQTLIMMPALFLHVERLLEDEILRSRAVLYQSNSAHDIHNLPEPSGTPTMLKEKIYIPVNQYPEYNFVGRILGPRGMTAKQLEQETGCKIMVRGKGSIRDKKMESINRGKANWEHLNDDLHVLITVEDTNNRADVKMQCAIREINKLLIPAPEGEDNLKKMQLMELAIMNGTYRDNNTVQNMQFSPQMNNYQLYQQSMRSQLPMSNRYYNNNLLTNHNIVSHMNMQDTNIMYMPFIDPFNPYNPYIEYSQIQDVMKQTGSLNMSNQIDKSPSSSTCSNQYIQSEKSPSR